MVRKAGPRVTRFRKTSYEETRIDAIGMSFGTHLATPLVTSVAASLPQEEHAVEMKFSTGHQVAFQLADVICPDFEQITDQLGPDLSVAGEVTLLSDRGGEKGQFAVVQVRGINAPLIVPVGRLSSILHDDQANITTQS